VVGHDPAVRIVHADALAVDWRALVPAGSRLVANLPYNLATPLLFHALAAEVFSTLLVMVQKEVGQRWAAPRGHPLHSGVSVRIGALADVRVVAPVPRTAFRPVPNVDSVTVALQPRPWPHDTDRDAVFALVEAGFAHRRKRLRNALATPERPPAAVEAALQRAGLGVGARAEELELDDWVRLTAALPG
jgi:16S rRNA (adenine1518-N6/adenine1519-N6)-dimethyltransferase